MDYAARHRGIVTAVSTDRSTVDIRLSDDAAECGGCALHGLCSHDNSKGKNTVTITAVCDPEYAPAVGTAVEAGLPDSVRWFSSIVVLLIPIVLFTAVLLGTIAYSGKELTAVIAAFIVTAVYFVALIPLRRRLGQRSRWRLIAPS
ncbi:MAG: SoxR reducing system RseC family protein [Muribaculum sp.]|nr:SoxR reducing system RseC family protein [Muribaculum sp.]